VTVPAGRLGGRIGVRFHYEADANEFRFSTAVGSLRGSGESAEKGGRQAMEFVLVELTRSGSH